MDLMGLWIVHLFTLVFQVFVFTAVITAIVVLVVVIIGKRPSTSISPKTEAGDPRLVRIPQRKTIAGVCAGFAYKFGAPIWIVQTLWVVVAIGLSGTLLIAYVVLWIMMPKASEVPDDYKTRTENF